MPSSLTDEEVICAFMEPKPPDGAYPRALSDAGWWKVAWSNALQKSQWLPNNDKAASLDALWEVEERLTEEQWGQYCIRAQVDLYDPAWGNHPGGMDRPIIHATAEQKIRALAAVLRTATAELQPARPPDGGRASNN